MIFMSRHGRMPIPDEAFACTLRKTSTHKGLLSELTDMIIDHLQYDKQALVACSLVCRQWRPRSQFHLFRRLLVSGMSRYKHFITQFILARDSDNLRRLRSYVRELTLTEAYGVGERSGDRDLRIHESHFPRILASLPFLHRLYMRDTIIILDGQVDYLRTIPRKLDEFKLVDVMAMDENRHRRSMFRWILPFHHMFSVINSFSIDLSDDDEVLSDDPTLLESVDHTIVPPHFPIISAIHLDLSQSYLFRLILEHFCRCGAGRYLNSISIVCSGWEDLVWLTKLLGVQSPPLKQLTLDLQWMYHDTSLVTAPLYNLDTCVNLRVLEIEVVLSGRQPDNHDWNGMIAILEALPRKSLNYLRIQFHVNTDSAHPEIIEELVLQMDWSPVDRAISAFSSLRQVLFQYKLEYEEISDDLWNLTTQELVPSVYQRGILTAHEKQKLTTGSFSSWPDRSEFDGFEVVVDDVSEPSIPGTPEG